jgi:hypothetical protein
MRLAWLRWARGSAIAMARIVQRRWDAGVACAASMLV